MMGEKSYSPSNYDLYGSFQSPDANHIKPIEQVRKILYGDSNKKREAPKNIDAQEYEKILNSKNFGRIDLLRDFIKSLPDQTVKILLFSPRHYFSQPITSSYEGARIQACKAYTLKQFGDVKSTKVIDFLIDGVVTRNDSNFWDGDHFNYRVARKVIPLLVVKALKNNKSDDGYYKLILSN